jgi:hypothetical protein
METQKPHFEKMFNFLKSKGFYARFTDYSDYLANNGQEQIRKPAETPESVLIPTSGVRVRELFGIND